MADRTLLCGECRREFVFTDAEQEFFRERGFEHEPKRCIACRRRRRRPGTRGARGRAPGAARGSPTATAAAPPRAASEPRTDVPLHTAVCSDCGAETQVPFEPDGVRPVFCMPCLKQQTR